MLSFCTIVLSLQIAVTTPRYILYVLSSSNEKQDTWLYKALEDQILKKLGIAFITLPKSL